MDDRTSGTSPVTTAAAAPTASVTAPSTPPEPVATAPAATTPPDDAGGAEAASPEEQQGGAGDEEGIRVPVDLRVAAGEVTPATVSVPAFLPLEVTARSTDGKAHRVRVVGAVLEVPASGTATEQLDGLPRGTYPITVDGTQRAKVVAGDEPGP